MGWIESGHFEPPRMNLSGPRRPWQIGLSLFQGTKQQNFPLCFIFLITSKSKIWTVVTYFSREFNFGGQNVFVTLIFSYKIFLMLTWFWWNFNGRFLGTCRTYLIVSMTFVQTTFVLVTFVHIRNIPGVTDMIFTKL